MLQITDGHIHHSKRHFQCPALSNSKQRLFFAHHGQVVSNLLLVDIPFIRCVHSLGGTALRLYRPLIHHLQAQRLRVVGWVQEKV